MTTIARRYGFTGQLRRIAEAAERDEEQVSMMTLSPIGKPGADNELAVVVIKGHQEIEAFRRWARAQKLLGDSDCGMVSAMERPPR